jgi:hypothetical protein
MSFNDDFKIVHLISTDLDVGRNIIVHIRYDFGISYCMHTECLTET